MMTLATSISPGKQGGEVGTRTVAVVVCAYTEQRWDDVVRVMAAIAEQSRPAHEVALVIDHNPALLARARGAFPRVRVVENRFARGLSGAKNSGVEATQAELIVFLDDDAVPDADFLAQLTAPHADPQVLGVGGFLEPAWDGPAPRWFPGEFLWTVGCSYRGLPTVRTPVRNVFGGFMSVRRDVLRATGGFDLRLGRVGRKPLGGEETEWCIRAARAHPGQVFVYEPLARGQHRVTGERLHWPYFARRCYWEGYSKALIGRWHGNVKSLDSERRYLLRTLPMGVLREVGLGLRKDRFGWLRALNIILGVGLTAAGFLHGRLLGNGGVGKGSDPRKSP